MGLGQDNDRAPAFLEEIENSIQERQLENTFMMMADIDQALTLSKYYPFHFV